MEKPSNLTVIRNRIKKAQPGTVFVAVDFVDVSEKTNINAYLAVLAEEGTLLRALRGVYYKPQYNKLLKEYIAPDIDKVARAIARNYGWTIIPGEDAALNMLGLSTQVPAVYIYASDGPYKKYTVNNFTIEFKRTTQRDLVNLSFKTAVVIQALKALGKDRIAEDDIAQLRSVCTAEEKDKMITEAKTVTAWIYDYIRQICND
ncbi:MAG: hypothetical protein IJW83_00445 [Clostridia bacterium]|nr:hypothetical protein [Clostridia bacterium]